MDPAELLAEQNKKLDQIIELLAKFVEIQQDACVALSQISNAALANVDREPLESELPPPNQAIRAVAPRVSNQA